MSVPTAARLTLELLVAPRALAHYTEAELLHCIARILSRPGPLTERDAEEIAVVGCVFQMREKYQQILRAQMN